uniref:Uncharacterized protein n=1 Tax=Gadus morhua TaxID=8049 RepID=A0A8C5BVC0_GADMO
MTMSRSRSPEVQGSRGTLVPQHPEVRPDPQIQGLVQSRTYRAVQTPRRWTCDRYSVLTSGDSPGDEVTQDIIWDPTSPTQPSPSGGSRTTRMVKISDIVNRIAPKDVRPAPSPLLQWMGDCGVSCTPEPRTHRARRRSVRQSSVDGLVELARAFDRNMERSDDLAAAPRLHDDLTAAPRPHGDLAAAPRPHGDLAAALRPHGDLADDPRPHGNLAAARRPHGDLAAAPRPHGDLADDPRSTSNLAATSPPLPPPSESQRVEAELRALFDSSTQKVSGALSQGTLSEGPLSQGFSGPLRKGVSGPLSQGALSQGALSQGVSGPLSQGPLRPSDRPPGVAVRGPGPVVQDFEDDFEDDWEDDDLMNDSLVVATTSGAPPGVDSSCPPQGRTPGPRGGCPGPRTPQRSTFRLEPNPRCLAPPRLNQSQVRAPAPPRLDQSRVRAPGPPRLDESRVRVLGPPRLDQSQVRAPAGSSTCQKAARYHGDGANNGDTSNHGEAGNHGEASVERGGPGPRGPGRLVGRGRRRPAAAPGV